MLNFSFKISPEVKNRNFFFNLLNKEVYANVDVQLKRICICFDRSYWRNKHRLSYLRRVLTLNRVGYVFKLTNCIIFDRLDFIFSKVQYSDF